MSYCAPFPLGVELDGRQAVRAEHITEGTMTITYLGKCENIKII